MKKIFHLMALALMGSLAFTACDKMEDDLFAKDPATRQDEQMADFRRVFNNNDNGWCVYMACNTGRHPSCQAFAVHFDDQWCTFYSSSETSRLPEFYGQTDVEVKSLYSLKMDNGVVLSFDTYNAFFHYYADQSEYFESRVQSDFEFVLDRYSQNEDTIFGYTKIKHLPYMMVKMDRPAKQYQEACDATAGIAPYNVTLRVAGDELHARFLGGYKNLEVWTPDMDPSKDGLLFTYCCMPNGIHLLEPIEYKGHLIDEMLFNDARDRFISRYDADDYLHPQSICSMMLNDGNEDFYFGMFNVSEGFKQLLLSTGASLNADGRMPADRFYYAQISFEEGVLALYLNRWFGQGGGESVFPLNYEVVDDFTIKLQWDGTCKGLDYLYDAGIHVMIDKMFPKGQWTTWKFDVIDGSVWTPSSVKFYMEDDPTVYIASNGYYRYYYYGNIFNE